MLELWVEKHRPRTREDYVWAAPKLEAKVDEWMRERMLPNLLFSGGAGRGKTSLARLLLRELGIPNADILDINASSEVRKVDDFTASISNFVGSWALGETEMKYVLLDEADRLSAHSQDFLRAEIEKHTDHVRFILTCNHRNKISAALHSRLSEYEFSALTRDDAAMRAANILIAENVAFTPENLLGYVDRYYPDLRKIITVLQGNTIDRKLVAMGEGSNATKNLVELLHKLLNGDAKGARNTIRETVAPEDYTSVYRFLYTNIEIFAGYEDPILLIIRDALVRHTHVADTEINIAASMTEIAMLMRNK